MNRLAIIASCLAIALVTAIPAAVLAADLPDATKALLKKGKFNASVLDGVENELKVPSSWIEGARTEGAVTILSTWDPRQFKKLVGPFHERYPFVKTNYSRAGRYDRTIKPLMAFQQGHQYLADIIFSASRTLSKFKKLGALVDLRVLPNFKVVAQGMADPEGDWVGSRVAYRCIGYNTKKVKTDELPKTWSDLLTNPYWRAKGRLGLTNAPTTWVLGLWDLNGEKWGKDYIRRLFNVVKPQLRKEGQRASLGLVMAGEFDAIIPASGDRAAQFLKKGAPAGFYCPSPVPATVSEAIILKGSPSPNGAKLFLNWLLSKEGQVVQYIASGQIPVHKGMQEKRFLAFPETILGKPTVVRGSSDKLDAEQAKLYKFWNAIWTRQSGGG